MIEAGTSNLINLAQNLKPLLFQTKITNEDVFNFALFQSLPLDKQKNKVLVISTNEPGENVYEIKPVSYNESTSNYETFTKYLGLNDKQREDADSILNNYKKEIYSSILANDKNVFAVNPKLVELQQAVLADIISFAQKVNPEKSHQLFSQKFKFNNNEKISDLIASAKDIPQNEYLLITPDTIAKTHFKWNQERFNNYLSQLESSKEIDLKKLDHMEYDKQLDYKFKITPDKERNIHANAGEADYSFKIDSNISRVIIPSVAIENLDKLIYDSLRIKLHEAAKKIRCISVPTGYNVRPPKVQRRPDENNRRELKMVDPSEIVNKTMQMLSEQKIGELIEYGLKMSEQKKSGVDSAKRAKIKEAMNKMNKELQRLKNIKVDTTDIKK
jgi:hypothetical protein